jgi:hypothetical protein
MVTSTSFRFSLLLLVLCAVPASAKVKCKFDRSADFSQKRTYVWVEGVRSHREVVDYLIKATIDHQLQRRGLQKVETREEADLWIHYELGFGGEIHITADDPTYVRVGGVPMTYSSVFTNSSDITGGVMTKGSLGIEIFDRRRQALVWFASASEGIESRPEREEQLEKLVQKMFDKYPVKPLQN